MLRRPSLHLAALLINAVAKQLFDTLYATHHVYIDFVQYTLRQRSGGDKFSVDCVAEVGESKVVWWLEVKWTRGRLLDAVRSISKA